MVEELEASKKVHRIEVPHRIASHRIASHRIAPHCIMARGTADYL
jgi:hypothetical protein